MKKGIAEAIGTFILVGVGCGSAVFAGAENGPIGIGLAFGFALVAAVYTVGPVSGCHVNPAVTLAMVYAGKMDRSEAPIYIAGQIVGAIAACFVLLIMAQGRLAGFDPAVDGLAQNGWGAGYLGEYGVVSAFVWEVVATFILVAAIFGITQSGAPAHLAGIVLGMLLAGLIMFGLLITGVSLNPARSIGPAVFVGGAALSQLWLFILAPCIGAVLAAAAFKSGLLAATPPEEPAVAKAAAKPA
ncbi:MAG: aquaporin [Rhodobacteraceae bacterium]|nr:MAG: aquaporin [Paracoccaceae bacterium]